MLSLCDMWHKNVISDEEYKHYREYYRLVHLYIDVVYTPESAVDIAEIVESNLQSYKPGFWLIKRAKQQISLLLDIAVWLESKQLGGV